MTVSTTSSSVSYEGNDATTVFDFDFPIPAPATNLIVYITDEDGNVTEVPTNQYSISGLGEPEGGSITYPLTGDPLPTGSSITIDRDLPIVQLTSLLNQGGYYPRSVEDALDYLTMLIQDQGDSILRAIRLPVTVDLNEVSPILENPQAQTLIGWNSDGTALINYDLVTVEIMTPGPDTVSTSTIQNGAVTLIKLAQDVLDYIDDTIAAAIAEALAAIGGVQTGDIIASGRTSKTGYLECNGAAVSRATYDDLFDQIGETFGAGNGTTTFNLPDLRGRAPIGDGTGTGLTNRVLGSTGGAETVTLTAAQSGVPAHTHPASGSGEAAPEVYTVPNNITDPAEVDKGLLLCGANTTGLYETDNGMIGTPHDLINMDSLDIDVGANSTASAAESHTNMMPWQAVRYFIKT